MKYANADKLSELRISEARQVVDVQSREVGNSISLTIPRTANPRSGVKYSAFVLPDGTLIYQPKHTDMNPWTNEKYDKYDFRAARAAGLDVTQYVPRGKEL